VSQAVEWLRWVVSLKGESKQSWEAAGAQVLGECQVRHKETSLVLFKKAYVPIYICSKECLHEYFRPLRVVLRQTHLVAEESWLG
jgi:hypothetical protein